MFLRFCWAHITVIWSVCNMVEHCAITWCCYLTSEIWWIRIFSLNLTLTGLHKEVLNLPYVPMFILYPFRSAFGYSGRFLLLLKSPYRMFWFTNSGGSIQVWAPGKATGSIQTLHRVTVQILPAKTCWSTCHLIFTLLVIPEYWHKLPSYLQFLVCAQVWTFKELLGTQWE